MLEIEVTPRALMPLRRVAKGWRANRRSVPEAVAEDFEHAVKLLAFEPGLGTPTESDRYPDLRRFQIDRVRHHIFYHVKKGRLVVLAIWGSERELGPKL